MNRHAARVAYMVHDRGRDGRVAPPDAEEQPLQQRRAVAGGRDGGDGGEGHEGGGSLACGSSGAEGADGANGDGDDADDWGGRDLPLLVQPPKPGGFSGMEVLQRLAMSPEAQPAENIFLLTRWASNPVRDDRV